MSESDDLLPPSLIATEPESSEGTQRWRSSRRRVPALLVSLAALVAALSLLPVVYLLAREGVNPGRLLDMLDSPTTMPLIRNTIQLVVWVTLGTVVLGVLLAVLVTATDLPWRRFWMVVFTLPLGVPAFVSSYTWVAAGYAFFPQSTFIYGLRGAVIVLVLSLYPYVYLPTVAALRELDASQEWVARALGRGPIQAFVEVTLPRLRRAISGGALIVALHMLAEFGALELLRYRTLTTAIMQRATVLGSPDSARALSIVLALAALLLLAADLFIFKSASTPVRVGGGVAQERVPWRLGRWSVPLVAVSALVVVMALGVPLYGMVKGAVEIAGGGEVVDWSALGGATFTTARYAVMTAVVVALAALPISLLIVRWPSRWMVAIERAAWVAHSLPGAVVSLGLVYFAVRWANPVYQTSALLVAGYAVLYLPIAIGAQRVGLENASETYDRISRTLGRGAIGTFLSVTLPLAMPGIVVGLMLVMLNVSKELTMTLLLRPTGSHTLASRLWTTTNGEVLDFTAAAPYAITIILLTAVPTYLLVRGSLSPARGRG